jgi:hypothetical protein
MTLANEVRLVVCEPVFTEDDVEWESVLELTGIAHFHRQVVHTLFNSLFKQIGGYFAGMDKATDVYEYESQNSPVFDRNSLPRKIQVQVSEFSPKEDEEKWEPILIGEKIHCDCDEPGCQSYLIVENNEGFVLMSDSTHLMISLQLPQDVRLCKRIE